LNAEERTAHRAETRALSGTPDAGRPSEPRE